MTEHMVAIFETDGAADAAARDLESAGFPPQSIRRYRADSARSSGPAEGVAEPAPSGGGFWAWLLGENGERTRAAYTHDEEWYDQSVGAGKTVLSLAVHEDSRIHEAATILEFHHPLEIEETTTEDDETPAGASNVTAPAPSALLGSAHGDRDTPQARASASTGTEEIIPLAEENIEISKRTIDRGTTRIRRYVVETPVEREVTLHGERVTVERRTPATATGSLPGQFEERVVEVHESDEVPLVRKTAHVDEEVVIRREPTERTEKVRETVRREEVEVTPAQPDHKLSR